MTLYKEKYDSDDILLLKFNNKHLYFLADLNIIGVWKFGINKQKDLWF